MENSHFIPEFLDHIGRRDKDTGFRLVSSGRVGSEGADEALAACVS